MIAPVRPPVLPRRPTRNLKPGVVRRVARKLLAAGHADDAAIQPIPTWRSWMLAAWAVIVSAAYFSMLLGGWP